MTRNNLLLGLATLVVAFSTLWLTQIIHNQRRTLEACGELYAAVLLQETNPIDDASLAQVLTTFNVKYPAIVHAQAVHESANFTSDVFGHNHNLFGMKHPYQRVTTSLGPVRGYAYYASWFDSVIDYALWFQVYGNQCQTEQDVYKLLDRVYAEQPGYSGMIRQLAEQYKCYYE